MGKGIVDELKKDFDIRDEWVGFEIHKETPKEGVLLSEVFGRGRMEMMYRTLNRAGVPYSIKFGEMSILSNSSIALEAGEFARDNGMFDKFHEAVFYAYFTDIKDIGDLDVILEIAGSVGLDKANLKAALEEGRYKDRLEEANQDAENHGVNSTPTFIINDTYRIVGAQPIEDFRRQLNNIKQE